MSIRSEGDVMNNWRRSVFPRAVFTADRVSALALCLALILGPLISAAHSDGISNPTGTSGVSIPNFTANGGLPNWKACRAKVIANSPVTNCKVLMIGDSTTMGLGGNFNSTNSDARAFSYPAQLASALTTNYGINSSVASIVSSNAVGSTISLYSAYDTRLNAGTWILDTISAGTWLGGVNGLFLNADTTSPFSFNPADSAASFPQNVLQTDTIDVIGVGFAGAPTVSVSVNGGATIGTVNFSTAQEAFAEGTVSTTLGSNTWGLTCSIASDCDLIVVRAFNSAQSEVSIMNAGWDGAKTSDWVNTESFFNPTATIKAIAPQLCVISLLINEWVAGTATSTVSANTQTIINACKTAGADVLLVSPNPSEPSSASYALQQTYVAIYQALAATNNIPFLDRWTMLCGMLSGTVCPHGGWLAGMGTGWNEIFNAAPNALHQSIGGYGQTAAMVAQVLAN
jgi:hypothetical protein